MSDEAILARLDTLESESACRRVLARYFQICDRLGPDTPLDELGALFTHDARWQGKGRYREAFGGYAGREAIVAMIASYCAPVPHFAMTAHFFSAETIRVTGETALGDWMMLQCSTYADGRSDLRSAALTVGFAREDGAWRIADFQSLNLFSRRVDHWTDVAPIPVPTSPGDPA
jgi:hypothetical protein